MLIDTYILHWAVKETYTYRRVAAHKYNMSLKLSGNIRPKAIHIHWRHIAANAVESTLWVLAVHVRTHSYASTVKQRIALSFCVSKLFPSLKLERREKQWSGRRRIACSLIEPIFIQNKHSLYIMFSCFLPVRNFSNSQNFQSALTTPPV